MPVVALAQDVELLVPLARFLPRLAQRLLCALGRARRVDHRTLCILGALDGDFDRALRREFAVLPLDAADGDERRSRVERTRRGVVQRGPHVQRRCGRKEQDGYCGPHATQ